MYKKISQLALLIVAAFVFNSCKKNFDDYYARPATLAAPIYQQLAEKGKFSTFLSLIDKAGYKETLSAAGYWTIFAPTDSAFTADAEFTNFIKERGFNNVSAVDSTTAQMLVQYMLVYNAFEKSRIDDYQSSLGWVPDLAYKRRTAYYTGFYNDTDYLNKSYKAIASNRNSSYFFADNNNKYIPYFTDAFLASKGLSSADYTYFYPGSTYSGFNVAGAKVTEKDIAAENGVIHIIDKVVTPLNSIDQYLRNKPQYSLFRSIVEKFMVLFIKNADATKRNQVLNGGSEDVYVKTYSNLLAFSPNNENYFKLQDNDAQKDGWTLFVPNNDSLSKYINTVVLQQYPSVNSLPLSIIADLLNAHMWQSSVWPSKFSSTYNFLGEPVKMNNTTDIAEKKILSNGIFYGTKKVNEPNVFATVYGKAYLDPRYTLMTRLLDQEVKPIITNPAVKYTLFMVSDATLAARGYSYNAGSNLWTFVNPVGGATTTNDSVRINLLRMVYSGIVETPNNEMANLGATGVKGIIGSYGGEYIKFDGNKVFTAGSEELGRSITIDSVKQVVNGQVAYINDIMNFPYLQIGHKIAALGTPTTSEFNYFWNYLKNSTLFNTTTFEITGIAAGSFYTVFVPNKAAIVQAINDGLLPGTAGVPNYTPTLTADKLKVEKFISYHILDKRTVVANGIDIGSYPSLLRNTAGDPVTFSILYPGGVFELGDGFTRKARMVSGLNNNLSNRTVIHLVDNYLKY